MKSDDVIDWDEMSDEDKQYAQKLLQELNLLFDKYTEKEDPCTDDSISTEK